MTEWNDKDEDVDFRACAAELRSVAGLMHDPESREVLLRLATSYEALAEMNTRIENTMARLAR